MLCSNCGKSIGDMVGLCLICQRTSEPKVSYADRRFEEIEKDREVKKRESRKSFLRIAIPLTFATFGVFGLTLALQPALSLLESIMSTIIVIMILCGVAAYVRFLIITFGENMLLGVACVFFPPAQFIAMILYSSSRKAFFLQWITFAVAGILDKSFALFLLK